MSLFQISSLITAVSSFLIGLIAYLRNRKAKSNQAWFLTTLFICIWSIGMAFVVGANDPLTALYLQYILDVAGILIPVTFFVFILYLLNLQDAYKKQKFFAIIAGFLVSALSFTSLFKKGVIPRAGFNFWVDPGPLYFVFPALFLFFVLYSSVLLYREYKKSADNLLKMRISYILLAQLLGFAGGITDFFPQLFNIYPFGNYFIVLYVAFISYASFKYQLFNIKVVATEMLTFIIWVVLFVRFLLSETLQEKILDGGVLILVVFFGILLIRSVFHEVAQREQIEHLSSYKTELLSIVAHQLKNPLVVIKGYSSLVDDNTIQDVDMMKQVFKKIKTASDKLITLLNNLLDLHHIEEGKMHYEFQEIDLNKMVKEITDNFQIVSKQRKLELSFEPALSDVFVNGDAYKISQVFQNLIDNSLKYTETGWVKVSIRKQEPENNKQGKFVIVEISDSGRGMTQELIGQLFQKFARGVEERQILGTGLGLYISREIVDAHGGKVWAESDGEGKGSRFKVMLPEIVKNSAQQLQTAPIQAEKTTPASS